MSFHLLQLIANTKITGGVEKSEMVTSLALLSMDLLMVFSVALPALLIKLTRVSREMELRASLVDLEKASWAQLLRLFLF